MMKFFYDVTFGWLVNRQTIAIFYHENQQARRPDD